MNEIRKVALSGLGAVGTVLASRLNACLTPGDFRVIMNEERRQRFRRDGLYFNGERLDLTLTAPDEGKADNDLVIVAVKYDGLAQSLEDIRAHVGGGTQILLLLNGLDSEEMAAAVYGWDRVLYSIIVGTDATRDGNRVVSATTGAIHFGEARNDTPAPRVTAVKRLLDRAGLPSQVPADMLRTLWWKLMVNAGINQVSAILNAPYAAFQVEGDARDAMIDAQREVVRVARASGVDLADGDVDTWLATLRGISPEGTTSMAQDLRMGKRTENDYIGGVVVKRGRRQGVPTPVNDLLVKLIRGIERVRGLR